jgi:hypothetical protein
MVEKKQFTLWSMLTGTGLIGVGLACGLFAWTAARSDSGLLITIKGILVPLSVVLIGVAIGGLFRRRVLGALLALVVLLLFIAFSYP